MRDTNSNQSARVGVIAAGIAYGIWGFLPVYLKTVGFADPFEVLAQRILWSAPAALVAVIVMSGWRRGWSDLRAALRVKMLGALTLSATGILINWGLYIWAIANGHVMESALAYFLAPLVQVLAGVAFFSEHLRRAQMVAIAMAGLGVVVQGVAIGAPPWISLALCASWSIYALVRKQASVPAATGLLIETMILIVPAAALLAWVGGHHPLAFSANSSHGLLLALSGPFTAIPLILFSFAARRVQLSTLGVLQYFAPSLQFVFAVFYGEALTPARIVSFILIWLGLVVFTWDSLARERAKNVLAVPAE